MQLPLQPCASDLHLPSRISERAIATRNVIGIAAVKNGSVGVRYHRRAAADTHGPLAVVHCAVYVAARPSHHKQQHLKQPNTA